MVEVKSNREKQTYEENKKQYKGKREELFDEVFAKEIGFEDFKKANKDFEYHIYSLYTHILLLLCIHLARHNVTFLPM